MQFQTKYIICFEFDGKNFFGSQKQPDKRTVQGELEKALCTLIKDNITIIISGRTDAGVSAKYQLAHFVSKNKIADIEKFLYSLNCILPEDIAVFELKKVDFDFHAQKSARYKHYRYLIQNNRVASVFCRENVLFYPNCSLDVDRINESLSCLVGHFDFSSFKSKSQNPYDDCEIFFAKATEVKKDWQKYIFIDVIGNRFLYNMIRTIVGQLLLIERNKLNPSTMKDVLDAKDRRFAANVVDAKGLTLEYVGYDDVNSYIEKLIHKRKVNNENI